MREQGLGDLLHCERLLTCDDALSRFELYQRIALSAYALRFVQKAVTDGDRGKIPPATLTLLAGVDWRQLSLEQEARSRNYAVALASDMPLFLAATGWDVFRACVEMFLESDSFWHQAGRNLPENFALWATANAEVSGYAKATAALEAVLCSYLNCAPSETPWPDHVLTQEGTCTSEAFWSPCPLVDANGGLLSCGPRNADRRFRIVISSRAEDEDIEIEQFEEIA